MIIKMKKIFDIKNNKKAKKMQRNKNDESIIKNNVKDLKDLKEIIYNCADEYKDKTAFTIKHVYGKNIGYENVGYDRLLDDINKLGSSFYSLGLNNKRIAIIGKNRYEWVLSHLANLLGGIVSVPLDKDLQIGELESSLIRSGADAIVFDSKQIDKIREIQQNNKTSVKYFICMDNNENFDNIPELLLKGERILKSGNTEYINAKIDENKMAILLFTSGTTSKSKAVMLSQRNIASDVYSMKCIEDIRTSDTNIAFLPLHHIFGSTMLTMAIACGAKTVFTDGLRYIQKNLKEYEVSIFVGVPVLNEAIYKAVAKQIKNSGKEKLINNMVKFCNTFKVSTKIRRKIFKPIIDGLGGKLRCIISGGAPADSKVLKAFNDIGISTIQGYGLTETAPVVAVEGINCSKNGTVGKPIINETVEIINKDENGIGEVRVKGPNVMLGYYNMEEETDSVLKDGWFYTGDLGYIDEDGFLVISGRNKNMIVLKNGKKVFPEELETIINRLDDVSECMVFGLPDKDDKNDITLSVKVVYDKQYIKEHLKDATKQEIYDLIWNQIKQINTTFPRYKHIQKMILTDEGLIKTTTKKVKRQEEMEKILQEFA